MLNLKELIDWSKCPSGRVPVIVQRRSGFILAMFWIPKEDLQAITDLTVALCRCLNSETSGLYIDCDNDALLCRCDSVTQVLLPDRCLRTDWWWTWSGKTHPKMRNLWKNTYNGLLPVIVQDYRSLDFLMLAWMNQEAWEESVQSKRTCFFSRSKNRLWRKGEESGNRQIIREMEVCAGGWMPYTLLFGIEQIGGAACHEGYRSCFFQRVDASQLTIVGERVFDPKQVYKRD